MTKKTYTTIQAVEEEFNKVYLLEDKGIIRLTIAAVIANRLGTASQPIWLLIVGASGGGKCLAKDTSVLMYDGSIKAVQDIKQGDLLMGDDSTPRTVKATTQGVDTLYNVEQCHGEDYVVNSPHILSLKRTVGRTKGETIDINLQDYLSKTNDFRNKYKGYKVGVKFIEQETPIDPYFLGLWLGDGHRGNTAVSKPDFEVELYIRDYAAMLGMSYSQGENRYGKCPKHNIVGIRGRKNKLSEELKYAGLLNTKERFIPEEYKINLREVRLEVLAGLLDSDGYLDERQRFQFCNKSKKLVEDVQFLARSLGLRASNIYKLNKGIKSSGFKGTYWGVNIIGDTHLIPTAIPRKQADKRSYPLDVLATKISVKKQGKGEYYGFELDGNGRFLLGDFTVTHNTAVLSSLNQLGSWIVPVDTLTTNTFASGLQVKNKEDSSLLFKANGGLLVFKDFTTITAMNQEGLIEIMGQLRAIYDGEFNKKTGNGVEVSWVGKVGMIAAGTHSVQNKMRQFSAQGERFVNYQFLQPDTKEMTRRAVDNHKTIKEKEEHLQEVVREYYEHIQETKSEIKHTEIDEDLKDELVELADFATLARSPVEAEKSSRGNSIAFVPEREMPSRMATMLMGLVETFKVMEHGSLSDESKDVIIRIALDSIPLDRRMVLKLLARYGELTTKNLAKILHYPTDPVHWWCQQLDARKLISRRNEGANADFWKIKDEYREVILKYDNVKKADKPFTNEDLDEDIEGEPIMDNVDRQNFEAFREEQAAQTMGWDAAADEREAQEEFENM